MDAVFLPALGRLSEILPRITPVWEGERKHLDVPKEKLNARSFSQASPVDRLKADEMPLCYCGSVIDETSLVSGYLRQIGYGPDGEKLLRETDEYREAAVRFVVGEDPSNPLEFSGGQYARLLGLQLIADVILRTLAVVAEHVVIAMDRYEQSRDPKLADNAKPSIIRNGGVMKPLPPKRSTQPNEARDKLISLLTKHHRYNNGSCLNTDPIKNNELARMAEVDRGTASRFFQKEFGGYERYRVSCNQPALLVTTMKALNNEFAPRHFLQARMPDSVADAEE